MGQATVYYYNKTLDNARNKPVIFLSAASHRHRMNMLSYCLFIDQNGQYESECCLLSHPRWPNKSHSKTKLNNPSIIEISFDTCMKWHLLDSQGDNYLINATVVSIIIYLAHSYYYCFIIKIYLISPFPLKIYLISPFQASCGTIFPSFIHAPLGL